MVGWTHVMRQIMKKWIIHGYSKNGESHKRKE